MSQPFRALGGASIYKQVTTTGRRSMENRPAPPRPIGVRVESSRSDRSTPGPPPEVRNFLARRRAWKGQGVLDNEGSPAQAENGHFQLGFGECGQTLPDLTGDWYASHSRFRKTVVQGLKK